MKIVKNNTILSLFLATFIILVSVLFFEINNTYAAADTCTCYTNEWWSNDAIEDSTTAPSESACKDYCASLKPDGRYAYGKQPVKKGEGNMAPFTTKLVGSPVKDSVVKPVLQAVLRFVGWILNLAVLLFAWMIDPKTLILIIDNTSIQKTWALIRDLCNIAFILVLIFSAFATIFQVDKYNYKKILLWLIIMALLVNFSYPITRFIIDASNSLMYSVLNIEFSGYTSNGGEIFTTTPAFKNLKNIIIPANPGVPELLASIIFVFILAITILAISLILIIRTIALAIIVIFSPIGFVGTIIGKDGGWWGYLFKYALAGPIIALVLFVSVNIMKSVQDVKLTGTGYSADNMPIISEMAQFTIPIVILWIGIAMAVKGIEGAGTILGKAHGFAKWVGKLPGRGAKTYLKKLDRDHFGVRGAIKAWKDRTAELETDKVGYQAARARDWMGSIFDRGKRDPNFYRDVNDSNMKAKYKKEQDLFSTTDVDVIAGINKLKGKHDRESTLRREAFVETLAGNKDLNEWSKANHGSFDPELVKNDIYEAFGGDKNEDRAVDVLHNISDLNQINGVYSACGMTYDITKENTFDEAGNVLEGKEEDAKRFKQGRTRRKSTPEEQRAIALSKMKQIDYQKMMIGLHADSIVTEGADGKGNGVHKFGLKALEFIESKNAKFVEDRWRGDTGEKIWQGLSANPEVAARFPKIMAILEKQFGSKPEPTPEPKEEEKPKEEPKKADPEKKEEEPRIKVVGKYSPLK